MLPADPNDTRASDADRQRVAELLGEALASGQLSTEEHEERLEEAFEAKTMGQLLVLTRDLARPERPVRARKRVGAVFSKIRQGGAVSLPPELIVRSLFGATYFDLEHAEFDDNRVDLDARSIFGKLTIWRAGTTIPSLGPGYWGDWQNWVNR